MERKSFKRSAVELKEVVAWLDAILSESPGGDFPGAWNGLQIEGRRSISKIAAAVDASAGSIRAAIRREADLLIVHHGLYWNDLRPLTGARGKLYAEIFRSGLAVYSAHLPLDRHPVHGNNVLLARELGLERGEPFLEEFGAPVGLKFETRLALSGLAERLAAATGTPPALIPFGPKVVRRVGIVTGGGGNSLHRVAGEGIDTFITGEGSHWTFVAAQELEINVLYGGHYATETFGVRSLAGAAARQFGLKWEFINLPSGL